MLAKLTKQQIESATEILRGKNSPHDFSIILNEIAPFLQLPWEKPTQEEVKAAQHIKGNDSHKRILINFINHRNIHLISSNKKVEIVAGILSKHSVSGLAQSLAEDIVIALTED